MTLSEQLSRLAVRTKEVEDRASIAKDKARADLQEEVEEARQAAQSTAEELAKDVDRATGEVSAWWDKVGRSWNDHLATVRTNIDEKRAAHDVKAAQKAARAATRRRLLRHRLRLRGSRRGRVRRAQRRARQPGSRRDVGRTDRLGAGTTDNPGLGGVR